MEFTFSEGETKSFVDRSHTQLDDRYRHRKNYYNIKQFEMETNERKKKISAENISLI